MASTQTPIPGPENAHERAWGIGVLEFQRKYHRYIGRSADIFANTGTLIFRYADIAQSAQLRG